MGDCPSETQFRIAKGVEWLSSTFYCCFIFCLLELGSLLCIPEVLSSRSDFYWQIWQRKVCQAQLSSMLFPIAYCLFALPVFCFGLFGPCATAMQSYVVPQLSASGFTCKSKLTTRWLWRECK